MRFPCTWWKAAPVRSGWKTPERGAMWLQLGNKSMLMSQKLGQRLADDCMNPAQHAVNEALKKEPGTNLLDARPHQITERP